MRASKGDHPPSLASRSSLRSMATAAISPVIVQSPAGNPTSGCPIFLDADSWVVWATPFLDWQPTSVGPNGKARMQLESFQAAAAFLPRCKISRSAPDLAAAGVVHVMTVRLSDACWSRILTELSAAQVFAHKASSVYELHSFMENAVFQTPANLELKADDWWEAEAFVL